MAIDDRLDDRLNETRDLRNSMTNLCASTDGLRVVAGNLLRACEARERRLTKLEGAAD